MKYIKIDFQNYELTHNGRIDCRFKSRGVTWVLNKLTHKHTFFGFKVVNTYVQLDCLIRTNQRDTNTVSRVCITQTRVQRIK